MRGIGLDWVVIAGAARSGTTLLRELVSSHPQAAIFHEYGLMRLRQALELITSDPGAAIEPDDIDSGPECSRCSPLQLSTDHFARAMFETVFDKRDLRVVGDKMPLGSGWNILDSAIERFAGIRYILLLREPVAVLRSSLHRRNQAARGLDDWPVASVAHACAEFGYAWLAMQRLANAHPDRVFVLKYEDLCTDTADSMDAIFDFLGLPPAALAPLIRNPPPHERPTVADAEERAFISAFLEPLVLDWHGSRARDLLMQDLAVLCPFGEAMSLAHPRADAVAIAGFSAPEPAFRWTDGPCARLRLRHEPTPQGVALELHVLNAYALPRIGCPVDVSLNGVSVGTSVFTGGQARHGFHIPPAAMRRDRLIEVELRIHRPSRPGSGGDPRALGLALSAIRLLPTA